jgi:exonuclease SbcD
MKIIHTGDWHIGKLVHGVHMTEDQRHILKQLVETIENEKPQVLIIAGDIYDRSIPPVEAVELLDETLSEIILKQDITVIAIAGNHDSPDRVGFASMILTDRGLHIRGNISREISPIRIEDEKGPVDFYPIPFAEPAVVRELYGDDCIRSHDDAMKKVLGRIVDKMDSNARKVCISHAFVMGTEALETSESERPLSIGGSEYVNVDYFKDFDYVALGHLHRPQKVKHEKIRYSGSLLKYSFSEARQKKSITIVDMDGEGNIHYELRVLKPLRDLRIIKGDLNNLMDKDIYSLGNTEDYIMASLDNKGELIDPIGMLRSVYPNILRLEREQLDREAGEDKTSAGNEFSKKNPLELFSEFYENMSGEEFDSDKMEIVTGVLDEINRKGREA